MYKKIITGMIIAIAIVIGLCIHDVNNLTHGASVEMPTIICETGPEWVGGSNGVRITSIKNREHKDWRRSTRDNKTFFWCDLSTYHK